MRKLIEELNQMLYEEYSEELRDLADEYGGFIEYKTNGHAGVIEYLGFIIYDSENGEVTEIGEDGICVICDEEGEEKAVKFIDYLKEQINEIHKVIGNLSTVKI